MPASCLRRSAAVVSHKQYCEVYTALMDTLGATDAGSHLRVDKRLVDLEATVPAPIFAAAQRDWHKWLATQEPTGESHRISLME